jgi:hypothetical protein
MFKELQKHKKDKKNEWTKHRRAFLRLSDIFPDSGGVHGVFIFARDLFFISSGSE